ncbi:MAG: Omp28-related outer membrane protein, partial [Chitinophagales bacterium]
TRFYLFAISVPFILLNDSCTEYGPTIDLTQKNYDTYVEAAETPQDRIVVIEDFTGAACVNCPSAHEAIAEIISLYPENVIAIADYNFTSDPLYLDQNFWTQTAKSLGEYLGQTSWPASIIDRVDFENDNSLVEVPNNLMSYTEEELLKVTSCNIYCDPVYDNASRNLLLTVTIKYREEISTPNHISVFLVENGIIAAQSTQLGEVPDYVHNHVMRTMLTYYSGDALPEQNVAGRVYVFLYSFTIPENWNADNMQAVAFVHNFETDNKEILQAAIADIN